MKEWHYVGAQATRQGPVDGAALRRLNEEGVVNARTLVWREGLERWAHFVEVAAEVFEGEDGEPGPPLGACAYSGRVCPLSEMLPYGEALVCAEHKEAFVRGLMETGATGLADLTLNPFVYVGFWMRVLGSILDYLVKLPASWIFMIPYWVVSIAGPFSLGEEAGGSLLVALSIGTYAFGLLGMLGASIFYETWMVGKYQGTLGKMAIGAKVVKPDGARLNYKQAFYRWFANHVVGYFIVTVPPMLLFAVVFAVSVSFFAQNNPALFVGGIILSLIAYLVFTLICCGVYWMAAFDPEKRALHDRIAATRVVKK